MPSKTEEAVKLAMGWTDKQLQIYQKMGAIVVAMNAIDVKDLGQMTQEINRDEAFQPLINPTAWRDGNKFEEAGMVKTVVRAIIDFKKAVNGIGRFAIIDEGVKQ